MSRPTVGASACRTRTVSAKDIELFTELAGDRNPMHYDGTVVLDGTAIAWTEPLD